MIHETRLVAWLGLTILRGAYIALPTALASFALAGVAQARSFDGVDIAVEALAAGGSVAGVSIGPTEKELVKSVVRCGVGGKSALDCARDELVKRLPAEVQPFAGCIARGQRLEQCATTQALSNLPPQLRGAANCIAAGNNIAQCGKQFATDQASQAKLAALNQASATLDKLKTDAVGTNPLVNTQGPIQNIIGVAQGIQEGNAAKVLLHGSPELLKVAGRIVLNKFLPGPLAALLGPASDALIQNRFDLIANIAKAAEAGDEARLGELAIEALVHLNLPVTQACALIPDGAVKEVVCGFVADVIGALASVGGDGVTTAVDTARDICTGFGIDCSGFLGIDPQCGTPQTFYTRNFPACVKQGAFLKETNPQKYAEVEDALVRRCRNHFQPCNTRFIGSTSEALNPVCNPLREAFKQDVGKLKSGLWKVASRYADSYPPVRVKEKVERLPGGGLRWSCDYVGQLQKFIPDCAKALEAQFGERLGEPNCGGWNMPRADIFTAVCDKLYQWDAGRRMADKVVCEPGEVPPEPCLPPASIQPDGLCAIVYRDPPCPSGEVYSAVQQRCVNPNARPIPPPPPVITPPQVATVVPPPPPVVQPHQPTCIRGLPRSRGGCGCPSGTYEAYGRCNQHETAWPTQPPPIVTAPPPLRPTFVDPLPPQPTCTPGLPRSRGGCGCPAGTYPVGGRCRGYDSARPTQPQPSVPLPPPVAEVKPAPPSLVARPPHRPPCIPGLPRGRGGCGCPAGTYASGGACNPVNKVGPIPPAQPPATTVTRPPSTKLAVQSWWKRRAAAERQRASAARAAQRYREFLRKRAQQRKEASRPAPLH